MVQSLVLATSSGDESREINRLLSEARERLAGNGHVEVAEGAIPAPDFAVVVQGGELGSGDPPFAGPTTELRIILTRAPRRDPEIPASAGASVLSLERRAAESSSSARTRMLTERCSI